MAGEIQIRARMASGDVADVKILLTHPMETGLRKDAKTNALIPAYYIKEVTATLNGKAILLTQWGSGISKNPFFGFKVKGAKPGDFIGISTEDTLGVKIGHNAIVV